jgi:hypothetical protein
LFFIERVELYDNPVPEPEISISGKRINMGPGEVNHRQYDIHYGYSLRDRDG